MPSETTPHISKPDTITRLIEWTDTRPRDESIKHKRVRRLLDRFCPDLEHRRIVKVAGTNGKGSVCSFIEAGLLAAGQTVGVFTSPHLQRVTERIRINGSEISLQELDRNASELACPLKAIAEEFGPTFIPSFFEVMLLIAGRMFTECKVKYAVLEAGIGGRNDATALIRAELAAITTVSLDHEDRLGHTLSEIAMEKAGIASDDSTLVLGPAISPDILASIEGAVATRGVRSVQAKRDLCRVIDSLRAGASPLMPIHQLDNKSTAATVLGCLAEAGGLRLDATIRGLRDARCPGRYEYIAGSPAWLLDGAHNEGAIAALADSVQRDFPGVERILIYGASKGHTAERCLAILPRIAKTVLICSDFHNAVDGAEISRRMPACMDVRIFDVGIASLIYLLNSDAASRDRLVVVCGSLFLVGRVRTALWLQ